MGYRQYLYQFDKELVDKIRECKTHEQFIKVCKDYFPERNDIVHDECDDEEPWVSIYNLGKKLFEFGKYYENDEEVCEHGTNLFASEELKELYCETDQNVLTEEGLLCAIEWQKNRIISVYKNLLKEKSANEFDTRSQHERMKEHIKDHLAWWEFPAIDMDKDNNRVARSWLYEHTIFNLVQIYKTFDWNKYCLMFIGW